MDDAAKASPDCSPSERESDRQRGYSHLSEGVDALNLSDNHDAPTDVPLGVQPVQVVSVDDGLSVRCVQLAEQLDCPAKYSLCELVAAVLAMDFLDKQPYNRQFCTGALSAFAKHLQLPDKATQALQRQMHVCAEGPPSDGPRRGKRSGDKAAEWPRPVTDVLVEVRQLRPLEKYGIQVLVADMVALFVTGGVYDSRSRALVRHVAALLGSGADCLDQIELSVAHMLVEETYIESEAAVADRQRKARRTKYKRWALVGATGAVGGVLIGLTGGLAAPMVAAGAGAVIGGTAAGIATTAGAAVIGTLFGVGGAGLAGYKMSRRVGALSEFVVETLTDGQSLHACIALSGWVTRDDSLAFKDPWRHLRCSSEQYTVRYESQHLLELGRAMDYFMSSAVTFAIHQTLMETALAGLVTAVAWPAALLGVASALDNPWSVCVHRSALVGRHLAQLLLRRQHGRRPVSLLGFGLGARVIYHCLREMLDSDDAYGIVDNVYLLGAPVAGSAAEWHRLSSLVGGRLINGYCRSDWLLKFLYRTMNAQFSIAGTAPVTLPPHVCTGKVLNVNLSHIVKGHLDYNNKLRECLEACGVRVAMRRDESVLLDSEQLTQQPDDAAQEHADGYPKEPGSNAGDKGAVEAADQGTTLECSQPQ